MVWLCGLLPYQSGTQVFERIGKRLVSSTSIWEHIQQHGLRLKAYREAQQERTDLSGSCYQAMTLIFEKG
jgi:hypothetical protein